MRRLLVILVICSLLIGNLAKADTPSKKGSFSFGSLDSSKLTDKQTDIASKEEAESTVNNDNEDNSLALMFEDIAPGASILDYQEVIRSVPSNLNPRKSNSTHVYYLELREAMEKGVISESQAATLANYMSQVIRLFEQNCIAFKRKVKREGHDELVFSFSTGLVFLSTTSNYRHDRYGLISVDENSRIQVDWNDGSVEWYYIGKSNDGQIKLYDASKSVTDYTNADLTEVPMYKLIKCINVYLDRLS